MACNYFSSFPHVEATCEQRLLLLPGMRSRGMVVKSRCLWWLDHCLWQQKPEEITPHLNRRWFSVYMPCVSKGLLYWNNFGFHAKLKVLFWIDFLPGCMKVPPGTGEIAPAPGWISQPGCNDRLLCRRNSLMRNSTYKWYLTKTLVQCESWHNEWQPNPGNPPHFNRYYKCPTPHRIKFKGNFKHSFSFASTNLSKETLGSKHTKINFKKYLPAFNSTNLGH